MSTGLAPLTFVAGSRTTIIEQLFELVDLLPGVSSKVC
jgi:hypothetical protein